MNPYFERTIRCVPLVVNNKYKHRPAEIYCEMIVAIAADPTPILRMAIKNKSNTIFTILETIK